ncbi:MAG: hypothetical protein ACFFCI_09335 [Promethearchaeota archaeon]
MEEQSYYKKPIKYVCPICGEIYFSNNIYTTKKEKTCYPCLYKKADAEEGHFIIIDIDKIHVPYPESLYSSEEIEKDEYLTQLVEDVLYLPPIQVIKLSEKGFSLSNGYHRLSIFKHLNYTKIKCEVI